MKKDFTAIDFETAQGKRWSICQVGLVRVENGVVTQKINRLVCPPGNEYFYRNTQIHGITSERTIHSPNFSQVWNEIYPFIEHQDVVAHNAAFDMSCLNQALNYYNIPVPAFKQSCTYKIYHDKLSELCRRYQIDLNHHDALSDAMACAELYLMYLKS